ncbi:alpha-amlyase [Soehngenia saccharolytica]|nr:alpha-amlyase [Soehngenia saccharolytica]
MKMKFMILLTVITMILSGCTNGVSPEKASMSTSKETAKNDLIYFIMTDRFYDGDPTNNYDVDKTDLKKRHGGDLKGIIEKLDYIKSLGTTAIWLTPVMENEKDGYHGYWINDFYKVDPHLGTIDDLKLLVDEAHKRDMKVILDYVVNHVGYDSPWLNDPNYKDWFNENQEIYNWNDQTQVENGWLLGLPDLNFDNPDVVDFFLENSLWWIKETGIDGFRLDTVKHVPKEFWSKFTSNILDKYPDFFFLGEVWSENVHYIEQYESTGITGFTNYPLYKAITTTFNEYGKSSKLKNAIKVDMKVLNNPNNAIFIDNHDNPRFISKHRHFADEYYKEALTFIMTYPEIPVIYYGTEIGMEGKEDPLNRADMEWEKTENSPKLEYFKSLSKLRTNDVIANGEFILLETDDDCIAYQYINDKDSIIIVMNLNNKDKNFELKISGSSKKLYEYDSQDKIKISNGIVNINLLPLEIKIYSTVKL